MDPKIETTITRRISLTINKNQLLSFLINKENCGMMIPPHASVVTRVPYGCFGNEDMNIEEITIFWEEVEHK